jgi:hypothetical protein
VPTEESLEEIRSQLEQLAQRLDDLIYDALREAVEAGESGRPAIERKMTRARNAILRAEALLEEG